MIIGILSFNMSPRRRVAIEVVSSASRRLPTAGAVLGILAHKMLTLHYQLRYLLPTVLLTSVPGLLLLLVVATKTTLLTRVLNLQLLWAVATWKCSYESINGSNFMTGEIPRPT